MMFIKSQKIRAGFFYLAAVGAVAIVLGASFTDQAHTLYKNGVATFRAEKLEEAMQFFREAEEADPTYPYPILALARMYQERSEQNPIHYTEAAKYFEKVILALETSPPGPRQRDLYQAYYFQGLLYLRGGEHSEALQAFRKFLAVYPDFYDLEHVCNAMGVALYRPDHYDGA